MFRVERYILLYLEEYLGYILNNLSSKLKLSKKDLESFKNNLIAEMTKVISVYVSTFAVNIDQSSVLKMTESIKNINKYDPNYEINHYDIFLANSLIYIESENDYLMLSINDGDGNVIINQTFDISKLPKDKMIKGTLEAYTKDNQNNYLILEDGYVLIYNHDTKMNLFLTNLDKRYAVPGCIVFVGSNGEKGFLEVLKIIDDRLIKNEDTTFKIK